MFYQTESKPQGWRAVAIFDDRGDRLIYLGRSSTQVRAGFAQAFAEVLDDEEREHVRAIALQRRACGSRCRPLVAPDQLEYPDQGQAGPQRLSPAPPWASAWFSCALTNPKRQRGESNSSLTLRERAWTKVLTWASFPIFANNLTRFGVDNSLWGAGPSVPTVVFFPKKDRRRAKVTVGGAFLPTGGRRPMTTNQSPGQRERQCPPHLQPPPGANSR